MDSATLDLIARILRYVGWAFLPLTLLPVLTLVYGKNSHIRDLQSHIIVMIDNFNHWLGESVKWLLVLLVIGVAFGVIALSIFGQSWTKLDESAVYFHAIVIFLGAAATLLAGEHVRVDIFHSGLDAKGKAIVDFIGFYALLIPFCLILIWGSQTYVGLSWRSYEGSAESDGIKGIFLLKTLIPIFALTLLAQGLSIAGRAALVLGGYPEPPTPEGITPLFEPHDHKDTPL